MSDNNRPLEQLAQAATSYVNTERRGRWFTNFLKLALAIYLIGSVVLLSSQFDSNPLDESMSSHVAIVKLSGPIMPETQTSADEMIPLLDDAFSNKNSKAVFLQVNSPGGSAVQSGLIYDAIVRLKKQHPEKPVFTVVEDLCASGCYYIASATDKIYADKASIIGSIGVRFDGFGMTELMQKIGIENRSLAAGEHKRLMDPFSPADTQAQQHLQAHILNRTHEQFKKAVTQGRGDRLKPHPDLFTGLVWLGDESVEMGLIDGLGDIRTIAKDNIQEDNLLEYAPQHHWLDKLSENIGAQLAQRLELAITPKLTY